VPHAVASATRSSMASRALDVHTAAVALAGAHQSESRAQLARIERSGDGRSARGRVAVASCPRG
jgi:hypothetical protein